MKKFTASWPKDSGPQQCSDEKLVTVIAAFDL